MADLNLVNRALNQTGESMFLFNGSYLEGRTYRIARHGPQPSYDDCDKLNELAGIPEGDFKNSRYPSTGLEPLKLCLTSEGLFEEIGYNYEPVKDPWLQSQVDRMVVEDVETGRARTALAKELAQKWDNHSMALSLFRTAIWFQRGEPGEGWERGEGVVFWQVGRNASHAFYWGMKAGEQIQFFKGSIDSYDMKWDQYEVTSWAGYSGHC